jgi:hypothetical protein
MRGWYFLVCLVFSVNVYAQNIGLLPSTTFSYKLEQGWGLILKAEQRTNFYEYEAQLLTHELADFAFFAGKQLGVNTKWNTGFNLRFKDNKLITRFIQQLTIKRDYFDLACSHRFVWDLTKDIDHRYSNRLRYRFAGLLPFQGEKADVFELYGKWGLELINQFKSSKYLVEQRYAFYLGMKLSKNFQAELGPEFRLKGLFFIPPSNSRLWIRVNVYTYF